MDLERRIELATRNTEEVITKAELEGLMETASKPRAYWGFEPSGLLHLGTGLVCGSKIRDMIDAGFDFTILLADWHAWINNKLGGDLSKIHLAGEYFKHGFEALGLSPSKVRYAWASDLVKGEGYWERVVKIAKTVSLRRVLRALPIMGREMQPRDIEAAWLYYPCMQSADIFELDLDVACAGIDQRKAHILAREAADKQGWKKPISVHTHLLMALNPPSSTGERFDEREEISRQIGAKMSKSVPANCVFIHDPPETVREKIRRAYCPPGQREGNPILEIARYIVFADRRILEIPRERAHGGPVSYEAYTDLERDYLKGKVHPLDLKNGVAESLIEILRPVMDYFRRNPKPLKRMLDVEITR